MKAGVRRRDNYMMAGSMYPAFFYFFNVLSEACLNETWVGRCGATRPASGVAAYLLANSGVGGLAPTYLKSKCSERYSECHDLFLSAGSGDGKFGKSRTEVPNEESGNAQNGAEQPLG